VFLSRLTFSFTSVPTATVDVGQFVWNWLPATGHSGGLLLGFREECFEVGDWKKGTFFLSATVLQRNRNLKWRFLLVYGPADHSRSPEFLGELEREVNACNYPLVVGGDFNLIREARDKSNANINWPRLHRFNDAIAAMSLREIPRTGARFTWTNRQLNPIRCVLDRVFMSTAWEDAFPLCSLAAITRIGSDHTPLLLNSGEECQLRTARFFFQTWWLQVTGFGELVSGKLNSFLTEGGPHRGSIEAWQYMVGLTQRFLKGWGANLGKEKRDFRANLLARIEGLDLVADAGGLDEEGWALRYHLEDQILLFDKMEEEY
jgi:hypothetical protein